MPRGHVQYQYLDHLALGAGVLLLLSGTWEGALLVVMWAAFHMEKFLEFFQ